MRNATLAKSRCAIVEVAKFALLTTDGIVTVAAGAAITTTSRAAAGTLRLTICFCFHVCQIRAPIGDEGALVTSAMFDVAIRVLARGTIDIVAAGRKAPIVTVVFLACAVE